MRVDSSCDAPPLQIADALGWSVASGAGRTDLILILGLPMLVGELAHEATPSSQDFVGWQNSPHASSRMQASPHSCCRDDRNRSRRASCIVMTLVNAYGERAKGVLERSSIDA
jgi:hypothetical protein